VPASAWLAPHGHACVSTSAASLPIDMLQPISLAEGETPAGTFSCTRQLGAVGVLREHVADRHLTLQRGVVGLELTTFEPGTIHRCTAAGSISAR